MNTRITYYRCAMPHLVLACLLAVATMPTAQAQDNNDCNWEWVQQAGGTGEDSGYRVAIGPNGAVYLAGDFEREARFWTGASEVTLTSHGRSDIFLAN